MIIDAIFNAVVWLPRLLIGALPNATDPSWLCGSNTPGCMGQKAFGIGGYLDAADRWVPMSEALDLVPVFFGIVLACITFKVAQFCVSLFTGGGGAT